MLSIMVFSRLVRKILRIRSVQVFIFLAIILWIPAFAGMTDKAYATEDPLATPNNKFGIHIISPSSQEASDAASLVNTTGGDWGYITLVIESRDRDQKKWTKFFEQLDEKHLIPIVRLATKPAGNLWEAPYPGEEIAWADFLDTLPWPTKNRYVIIYNEPNHGAEWGGQVNPISYAHILNSTIDILKQKSDDFFVLNAGFDASAPQKLPHFADEEWFLNQMEIAVPGIFDRLDGWASHSYPKSFIGLPTEVGRGTINTFVWEMEILKKMGVNEDFPIFITETGWKHAEGQVYDKSLPSSETTGTYLDYAFKNVWNLPEIVAVTPFLLDYQESLFDHFSFKKNGSNEFYSFYKTIVDLPKIAGQPVLNPKPTPSPLPTISPTVLAAQIIEPEESFWDKIMNLLFGNS